MSTMKMIVEPGKPPRLEIEGETQQELWKQAAFWYSLPTVCPIDGFPVRLGYKKTVNYEFYSLFSTGPIPYEFPIGVGLGDRGMIPGKLLKEGGSKEFTQRWIIYDAKADKDIVFWENGRLLLQSPSQQAGNGKQDYEKRVEVAGRDALDEALDAAFGGEDAPLSQDGPEMFDEPSDLAKKRLGMITAGQQGTLHALGGVAGKLKWDEKRPGLCKWASDNRTDSSSQLKQVEAKKLIEFLEGALRKKFDALAQEYLEAGIAMPNVDPDAIGGVELANAYKACKKLGEKVAA
jgi:hypothetical protein